MPLRMHVAFADSSKRHIIFVDSSVAVNRALLPPSFNLPFLETLCPSDCPLVHLHNLSDSLQIDNDANKLLILNREMRKMASWETLHLVHDVPGILTMEAQISSVFGAISISFLKLRNMLRYERDSYLNHSAVFCLEGRDVHHDILQIFRGLALWVCVEPEVVVVVVIILELFHARIEVICPSRCCFL